MNNYLKKLSDNLYFLDDKEREKVINKYRKKIESKFKTGMSEKKAIKEVGTIDNIVNEVCSEYNLNYDYCIRKNEFDKDITSISNVVGNFIRDIIKVVKKVCLSWSLQSFLEVCIKIIVLVFLFMLFKIPFILIETISESVNELIFYPFDATFDYVNNLIMSIGYFLLCLLITLKIFGNYRFRDKKEVDEKELEKVDKEFDWLDFVIRVIVYLTILIPLGLLGLAILIILIIMSYLVLTGIDVIGIPITLIGLFGLIGSLFCVILDSLNHKKNSYLLMIIISTIIFILGISITIVNFNNFKYPKSLEKSTLEKITESKTIELNKTNTKLLVLNGDYQIIVDNNLNDNEVVVEVTYYDSYVDVLYSQQMDDDFNQLIFRTRSDENIDYINNMKYTLDDLRNGYIFDYSDVDKMKLEVRANENVKKYLEQ